VTGRFPGAKESAAVSVLDNWRAECPHLLAPLARSQSGARRLLAISWRKLLRMYPAIAMGLRRARSWQGNCVEAGSMSYQGVVVGGKLTVRSLLLGILLTSPLSGLFAGSVTLAWDPSPDVSVVGYRLYYGVASGVYTNSAAVGNVTNATVTGLANGTTYYFAATAFDVDGVESPFSNEATNTIAVPTNCPPTLDAIANVTVNESAALQTVNLTGISTGATNETQTLTVTATSSNPGLIPNPTVSYTSPNTTGTISFTPAAYAFGTATVTVTVNDGGASNNVVTRTFVVTVNSVNQAPTLNSLANLTVNEGAGLQTVNLAGISTGATNETQTLTVTATSSNPGLVPNPTVTYTSPNGTGTISFTPVAYAFGTATVTVTVNDGGASNNVVTRTFVVTVNSVNQAPTLNSLANLTLNEGVGFQTVNLSGISTGATNETQTLTVTATSSNPGLIPNPTVTYTSPNSTGTLSFTPVASSGGSATITVTVNDGGASNNIVTRTFTATVNRLPVITAIPNRTNTVGVAVAPISISISDAETSAASLVLSAASDNTTLVVPSGLVFSGTGATRTLTITPSANQTGLATITVTVSDGQANAPSSFLLNIRPKPSAPMNLQITAVAP
jgi:hypothetical protein